MRAPPHLSHRRSHQPVAPTLIPDHALEMRRQWWRRVRLLQLDDGGRRPQPPGADQSAFLVRSRAAHVPR
uniref:Uncharacterized protein n=1 Tax=Triticum urartu TaxID=4572 RepID=A0A8R7QKN5_TRIUA